MPYTLADNGKGQQITALNAVGGPTFNFETNDLWRLVMIQDPDNFSTSVLVHPNCFPAPTVDTSVLGAGNTRVTWTGINIAAGPSNSRIGTTPASLNHPAAMTIEGTITVQVDIVESGDEISFTTHVTNDTEWVLNKVYQAPMFHITPTQTVDLDDELFQIP